MATITIGRSPQNTIVVDSSYSTVSSNHATITDNGGILTLQDHSTNGTYVNGQHIHNQSISIRQGDRITLASTYELPWREVMRYFGGVHATQRYPQTPQTMRDVPRQAPQVVVIKEEKSKDESPEEPMPEKHMALAIISLLLGFTNIICLILSIIAIVNASQVESKWRMRDYAGARQSSEKANSLGWWSIVIAFIGTILYIFAISN